MSLLGMPTPRYMPLDRGDGMDQFGRPMESQLSDDSESASGTGSARAVARICVQGLLKAVLLVLAAWAVRFLV